MAALFCLWNHIGDAGDNLLCSGISSSKLEHFFALHCRLHMIGTVKVNVILVATC